MRWRPISKGRGCTEPRAAKTRLPRKDAVAFGLVVVVTLVATVVAGTVLGRRYRGRTARRRGGHAGAPTHRCAAGRPERLDAVRGVPAGPVVSLQRRRRGAGVGPGAVPCRPAGHRGAFAASGVRVVASPSRMRSSSTRCSSVKSDIRPGTRANTGVKPGRPADTSAARLAPPHRTRGPGWRALSAEPPGAWR